MASQHEKPTPLPTSTKACVRCRSQKMRCIVDDSPPCRRCRSAKIDCVFKPRANAAFRTEEVVFASSLEADASSSSSAPLPDLHSVVRRLQHIEDLLGIKDDINQEILDRPVELASDSASFADDPSFEGVLDAANHLQKITRGSKVSPLWAQQVIRSLWYSFHRNMPGLHFLSTKKAFLSPTPLLLASVLYAAASVHESKGLADLAPQCFEAFTSAIADLAFPSSLRQTPLGPLQSTELLEPTRAEREEIAFSNVLGVILAGLMSEGYVEETGIWISMGYRILLDNCPIVMNDKSREWRGLFAGLQTVDLEHASLHMTHPVLPIEAPLLSLVQVESIHEDAFRRLSYIQRKGLNGFLGRGLPTIWSSICEDGIKTTPTIVPFSEVDIHVVKDWAKRLDEWLAECVEAFQSGASDHERWVIFLQYHLHKLFVLSVYYPARGFDLFPSTVALNERLELLKSSQTAIRLHQTGMGIWSNWDLVMITWAALLIIQGIMDGIWTHDDLHLVKDHQIRLQSTLQPPPSLRSRLATRLESLLKTMSSPPSQSASLDFGFSPNDTLFDPGNMDLATATWLQDEMTTENGELDMGYGPPLNTRTIRALGWF